MAPLTLCRGRVRPATARGSACHAFNAERSLAAATCSVAAATALLAAPAIAGVALEQPKLKNFNVPDVVQEIKEKAPADPANRLKRKAESAANAVTPDSGPSLPKVEVPQLKFDTQSLWPLGLVAAPAALFGLSKIDPGTEKIFETGWVKDSGMFGIGTEDKLKNDGGYCSPYYEPGYIANAKKAGKQGTKMLKKAGSKASKALKK